MRRILLDRRLLCQPDKVASRIGEDALRCRHDVAHHQIRPATNISSSTTRGGRASAESSPRTVVAKARA